MAFPPGFLDELRARLSLADVVGRKVQLKRRSGSEYAGLCPFHNEKTPSFTVNDKKGFYHCFGCGVHGDVIGFAMQTENLTFPEAVEQLNAYFAGTRTQFDLDLELMGTAFQRKVWQALLTIPFGETRSYGEIAEQIGSPTAYRAVGLANGHNPVGIIVPCHRVIGANGNLTGYGGGLDKKRALLEMEKSRNSPALF